MLRGLCYSAGRPADDDSGRCSDSFFETLTNLAARTVRTAHANLIIVIGIPYRKDKLRITKLITDTTRNTIGVLSTFKHA